MKTNQEHLAWFWRFRIRCLVAKVADTKTRNPPERWAPMGLRNFAWLVERRVPVGCRVWNSSHCCIGQSHFPFDRKSCWTPDDRLEGRCSLQEIRIQEESRCHILREKKIVKLVKECFSVKPLPIGTSGKPLPGREQPYAVFWIRSRVTIQKKEKRKIIYLLTAWQTWLQSSIGIGKVTGEQRRLVIKQFNETT